VATVILVRHGRTSANASGVLAGRQLGVVLDEVGVAQAIRTADRLAGVSLSALVSSPLERTMQTAETILERQKRHRHTFTIARDERLAECDYGTWQGRSLKELSKEPLWKQVQGHPSSVTFPQGESMVAMQTRAVEAIREWNATLGEKAVYAVVSHGDVIKAILADALGMHLDQFQRIAIDPCSLSVVSYTKMRPFVLRTNDSGSDVDFLTSKSRKKKSSDAAVGGGGGHG
jgi:probable phosphomutase (TIGR03848 family)